MMSLALRIELIILAIAFVFVIVRNVNRKRLRIQYSFIWLIIALALIVAAFFPNTVVWLCGVLDIETPSNLVYLLGIIVLLLITFHQTQLISRQADQIKRLTQMISLEKYKREENENNAGCLDKSESTVEK